MINSLVKLLNKYEENEVNFRFITNISTANVIEFYVSIGRFPSNSEIETIKTHGIDRVINSIREVVFQSAKR